MGLAGFPERPFRDDDPLVCSCGATLGAYLLTKEGNEKMLAYATVAHEEEHKKRMVHQARHRSSSGSCEECAK